MPGPWFEHRAQVGRFGEAVAASFLQRKGARVLDRNLEVDRGEIDLVIDLDGRRVAVEVKTVVGEDLDPADAFTPAKASQVLRLAGRLHPPIRRVDLVAVRLGPRGVVIRWMVDAG